MLLDHPTRRLLSAYGRRRICKLICTRAVQPFSLGAPSTGMPPADDPSPLRRAFSLLEMLVVMLIVSILLGGLLVLFSRTTYIARTQADLSVLQQSLRVAHSEIGRYLRMAGAGGLPISWSTVPTGITGPAVTDGAYGILGAFPNGFAVSIQNNVAGGTNIAGFTVLPGTDVLTIRGVLTSPVYYLPNGINVGSLITANQIPGSTLLISEDVNEAFDFSLNPLIAKVNYFNGLNQAMPLILRDITNPDAYFVAQLDNTNTNLTLANCPTTAPATWGTPADAPQCISLGVKFNNSDPDAKTKDFGNLSFGTILEETGASAFQLTLPAGSTKAQLNVPRNIHSVGVLEEFRYFLRAAYDVPGDSTSRLRPILTRAEFVAGTNIVLDTLDIASGILDLQLAVGIETEGLVDPGEAGVPAGYGQISDSRDNNDEILYNSDTDVLTNAPELTGLTPATWYNPALEFHFVRITTLAESQVSNLQTWSPAVNRIEDHDLQQSFSIGAETYILSQERRFPRSYLQTVVEMRNLK